MIELFGEHPEPNIDDDFELGGYHRIPHAAAKIPRYYAPPSPSPRERLTHALRWIYGSKLDKEYPIEHAQLGLYEAEAKVAAITFKQQEEEKVVRRWCSM